MSIKINPYNDATQSNRVIGNFSGGCASAIACAMALETYEHVHIAFCDTNMEHPDTYALIGQFQDRFGVKIHRYTSSKFHQPESVWNHFKGLNFAHGAPCSTELKRVVRVKQIQDLDNDYGQVFGFTVEEERRALNMKKNYPEINPLFPLIENSISKEDCFDLMKEYGLKIPDPYRHFLNNNCIGHPFEEEGGCVQGGIGYWQKMKTVYPRKFDFMAEKEHDLSALKGKPVTICKDQRKATKGNRLFLKACPDFPEVETIDVIKGRQPETVFECNGFCSTEDKLFEDFN